MTFRVEILLLTRFMMAEIFFMIIQIDFWTEFTHSSSDDFYY